MPNIKSFKPKTVSKFSQPNLNFTKDFYPPATLKVIPLGGVGDVTKNMYVYEYENDIVIIDCGVGFPDEGMLGIDLVIPNISYLREKKSKIRGILITHGHDDHIGGLPYIWPELDVPIYSRTLTCGFIKAKFSEHNLPKDKINIVKDQEVVTLGAFRASFYNISHSIPDTVGIVLTTPVGTLVHQSDFKIDWTPVVGQKPDVGKIAQVGREGVTFMTIDCLRADRPGYTATERSIENSFQEIEQLTRGKLLITMTSSNVSRIQQAIHVAIKSGRKVSLSGRSMEMNFQVALDLGFLDVPAGLVVPQEELKRFASDKLLVLIAGSQGQPESALSRAANGDHKFVHLTKDDAIIFSADPIPSTMAAQNVLIDTLSKIGCSVYYAGVETSLHVSGHAAAEELKLMINLLKPKYLMPIGGNYKHMRAFAKLAIKQGYNEDQLVLVDNGEIITISKNQVKIGDSVDVSNVYVDGLGVGDVGNVVLRDRQVLAEDGVVIVVVGLNKKTFELVSEPDIISRGFIYERDSESLLEAAKEIVKSCLRDHKSGQVGVDWRYTRRNIEDNLEKFFYEETNRRPMILTVVVDL